MGRLTGSVFAAFDDDDFRWWIGRLADAGDAPGVHQTMGHRDRQGINAWFAARDGRNEAGGYAGDLDRAWDLADAAAGSAEAAGLQSDTRCCALSSAISVPGSGPSLPRSWFGAGCGPGSRRWPGDALAVMRSRLST